MAAIAIDNGNVIIKMQGARKIWTLRSELKVALSDIVKVDADPEAWHDASGLRIIGSHVPGLYKGGAFLEHGNAAFYDLTSKENAIAISLKDEGFSRIIIGVDDPGAEVEKINKAISA